MSLVQLFSIFPLRWHQIQNPCSLKLNQGIYCSRLPIWCDFRVLKSSAGYQHKDQSKSLQSCRHLISHYTDLCDLQLRCSESPLLACDECWSYHPTTTVPHFSYNRPANMQLLKQGFVCDPKYYRKSRTAIYRVWNQTTF